MRLHNLLSLSRKPQHLESDEYLYYIIISIIIDAREQALVDTMEKVLKILSESLY